MENFSDVAQNAPETVMQQGNGGGGAATDNIAAQRKLANGARGFDAVDKGKENTGKNSGFSSFSRTASQVTTQAAKNKVTGAKSAATRASNNLIDNLGASDAVTSKLAARQVKAADNLKSATAAPVSAAKLVNSKSKKSQATKYTGGKKKKKAVAA